MQHAYNGLKLVIKKKEAELDMLNKMQKRDREFLAQVSVQSTSQEIERVKLVEAIDSALYELAVEKRRARRKKTRTRKKTREDTIEK